MTRAGIVSTVFGRRWWVALVLLPSCSWALTRAPANPVSVDECPSLGPAHLDGAVVVTAVALDLLALGLLAKAPPTTSADPAIGYIAGSLVVAGLFGLSGLQGREIVTNCRQNVARRASVTHETPVGSPSAVAPVAQSTNRPANIAVDQQPVGSETLTLTELARRRAAAGDCGVVRSLERRVRELDGGYHDTVFVRDPPIARCLAPTGGGN